MFLADLSSAVFSGPERPDVLSLLMRLYNQRLPGRIASFGRGLFPQAEIFSSFLPIPCVDRLKSSGHIRGADHGGDARVEQLGRKIQSEYWRDARVVKGDGL